MRMMLLRKRAALELESVSDRLKRVAGVTPLLVTPAPFCGREPVHGLTGGFGGCMKIEAATSVRTDPAPLAHESMLAEQRRLDAEDIEARPVAAGINGGEHDFRRSIHAEKLAQAGAADQ